MKRLIGKALKILIVPLLFLANYPIQKALVGEWEDKFGGEMVYLPYWKHWMEDEATAYHVTQAARHFEKTKGAWPTGLQDLKEAKFIPQNLPPPSGGQYVIDPKQRRARIAYAEETDVKRRREEIAFEILSAADRFEQTCGRPPADLDELVEKGIMDQIPKDPGGCEFCYDPFRRQVGIQYGAFIRQMHFGWNNILADLLWIRGFHYVQGQWQLIEAGRQKPEEGWHMQLPDLYEVVTDLDPHFIPAYRGGAVLVNALSKKPRRSIHLLEKGVRYNPRTYWELPYELACIILLETGDEKRALEWLQVASDRERYPKPEPMVLRLRAFLEAKHDRFDVAIRIWEPWLESDSPVYRQVAEERISRLLIAVIQKRLADGAVTFRKTNGREITNEEFAAFVKLLKKHVAEEYGEKPFEGAVRIAMETGFQLWQFVRFRPPAGEPLKTTTALGPKRQGPLVGLQKAAEAFKEREGHWPDTFDDLLKAKLIEEVPSPEGGGEYYLELYPRSVTGERRQETSEQEAESQKP